MKKKKIIFQGLGTDSYRRRDGDVLDPASFPALLCLPFLWPHHVVAPQTVHPKSVVFHLYLTFCGHCVMCFATECQSPALDA